MFKGLRIITNLHCNYRCMFCYQKDKSVKVLSLPLLRQTLAVADTKRFEYCTIMGGEATLLPNLEEYIDCGHDAVPVGDVRLTTNGFLLTRDKLELWKNRGLTGVNISVPVMKDGVYQHITGSPMTPNELLHIINECKRVFGNHQVRINIPLCRQNTMSEELDKMLMLFLHIMDVKVTLCDDLFGTHSILNSLGSFGLKKIKDTGFGLVMLDYAGQELGYYCHKDNYKGTDLIVSPVGTFVGWDDYCKAVGFTV